MVAFTGLSSSHPPYRTSFKSRRYPTHAAKRLFTLQVWLLSAAKLMHLLLSCWKSEADIFIENACAAIAKILHFNKQSVENPQAVANQWYFPQALGIHALLIMTYRVNTLPVTNDEEAAPYAYGYLVELIEQ